MKKPTAILFLATWATLSYCAEEVNEEMVTRKSQELDLMDIINSDDNEKKAKPKPFGYGVLSSYIGGSDVNYAGEKVTLLLYIDYLNYRRMSKTMSDDDEAYHERFTMNNHCIEGCSGISESSCKLGLCTCNNGTIQMYGKCFNDNFLYFVGDEAKHRKPEDNRPDSCFERRGKNNDREVIQWKADSPNHPECHYTWIKPFKPFDQGCNPSASNCTGLDMNFFCDPSVNKCKCRPGTKWNHNAYECQISMEVDCIDESESTKPEDTFIKAIEDGRNSFKVDADNNWDNKKLKSALCYILETKEKDYSKERIDDSYFLIFGLSAGAFFAVCCGSICGAICCCKCCNSCREKLRQMDPRYIVSQMSTSTQMAAVATVAAGEYMESRDEKEDAMRMAQIQGNVPPPPPGYAPVPTNPAPIYPQQYPGFQAAPPQAYPYPQPAAPYPPGGAPYPQQPAGAPYPPQA